MDAMIFWTRLQEAHVPWIALAIASAGTALHLAVWTADPEEPARIRRVASGRLNVERALHPTPPVERQPFEGPEICRGQQIHDDLVMLLDDLQENQALALLHQPKMLRVVAGSSGAEPSSNIANSTWRH